MPNEFEGAPGCFGSALTFRPETQECAECIFAAACKPRSEQALETLRAKFNIVAPDKTPKQIAKQGFTLPVKTAALLERIKRLCVDAGAQIRAGYNPFLRTPTPPFLALATHLVLQRGMSVSRANIEKAMETQFGWAPQTAKSHALQAVQALVALGAVEEDRDGMIRRRAING